MAQYRGRSAGGRATNVVAQPRRGGDLAGLRNRLTAVVAPLVAKAGYDLEDLSVSRVGRRHLVRVVVDADGGVSLDAVTDLSRHVSQALDAAERSGGELIAGEYQLEVSSPGVDRPLTAPRHWRRNVGRLVKVKAGDRQVLARISAADDAGVVLDVDGVAVELDYDRLGPGRVQVEFARPGEADGDEEDLAEDGFDGDDLGQDRRERGGIGQDGRERGGAQRSPRSSGGTGQDGRERGGAQRSPRSSGGIGQEGGDEG